MKLSLSKRLLTVMLSVLFLFSAIIPTVFATEKSNELGSIEATCPTIYIHGFACGDIYAGIGTEEENIVWPMQNDVITTAIETAVEPIANYLLTHNWAAFEDALIEVVNILFEGAWNNPDGTAKDGTGIKWSYPANIGKTSTVSFNYDWRGNPLEIADDLADFIDYVLAKTGCEKVAIECHSMGGIIFMSYAAKYGLDKIHGAVMDSTAIYGASYMGELFSNRFVLDGEAVYSYLLYAFSGIENEETLDFLMDSLFAAGVFDVLELAGEELVRRSFERVARDCLIPLFGYWPSVWAMIPDADYEVCEEFVFDTILADSKEEHAVLRSKVQAYNEQVRPYRDGILQELANSGRLMVISRYGFSMAPVSSNWDTQSDGVIDTKYSSFGATAAPYGEQLSEEYISEHKALGYISPDDMVDASTCSFPNVTWFIRDLQHSSSTGELDKLKNAVLFADTPIDIYTYEEYPQYLIKAGGQIVVYETYDEPDFNILYSYGKIMQTIRDKIEEFFMSLIDKLKNVLN